jgi:hypothetical protein
MSACGCHGGGETDWGGKGNGKYGLLCGDNPYGM